MSGETGEERSADHLQHIWAKSCSSGRNKRQKSMVQVLYGILCKKLLRLLGALQALKDLIPPAQDVLLGATSRLLCCCRLEGGKTLPFQLQGVKKSPLLRWHEEGVQYEPGVLALVPVAHTLQDELCFHLLGSDSCLSTSSLPSEPQWLH